MQLRLSEQIIEVNPILVGVSFGGMIAVEVAKLIETEKVILISSAKTKHEIPQYYQFAGAIKIVNWKNEIIPENTIHIHGNADKILPIRFVKPDYTINKAGHFMIVHNAREIDVIISNNK
jgi:alpha/beta superfamily hydrolase